MLTLSLLAVNTEAHRLHNPGPRAATCTTKPSARASAVEYRGRQRRRDRRSDMEVQPVVERSLVPSSFRAARFYLFDVRKRVWETCHSRLFALLFERGTRATGKKTTV